MVSPSFSMDEELLRSFDETINELKREQVIDMDTGRSEIARELIRAWIEENQGAEQGNLQSTITSAMTEAATNS